MDQNLIPSHWLKTEGLKTSSRRADSSRAEWRCRTLLDCAVPRLQVRPGPPAGRGGQESAGGAVEDNGLKVRIVMSRSMCLQLGLMSSTGGPDGFPEGGPYGFPDVGPDLGSQRRTRIGWIAWVTCSDLVHQAGCSKRSELLRLKVSGVRVS